MQNSFSLVFLFPLPFPSFQIPKVSPFSFPFHFSLKCWKKGKKASQVVSQKAQLAHFLLRRYGFLLWI